jgi:hypothetical protein
MDETEFDHRIFATRHQRWLKWLAFSLWFLAGLSVVMLFTEGRHTYRDLKAPGILIGAGGCLLVFQRQGGFKKMTKMRLCGRDIVVEYHGGFQRSLSIDDVDPIKSLRKKCDYRLFSRAKPWNDPLVICCAAMINKDCEAKLRDLLALDQ